MGVDWGKLMEWIRPKHVVQNLKFTKEWKKRNIKGINYQDVNIEIFYMSSTYHFVSTSRDPITHGSLDVEQNAKFQLSVFWLLERI